MSKSPNPKASNLRHASASHKQQELVLLDSKQWSYVQRRHDLTPRELQIAQLVCQGLASRSIAKHLDIRPGTVKTHMRNIYRKVRVRSKIAMLVRFLTQTRELSDEYNVARSIRIAD